MRAIAGKDENPENAGDNPAQAISSGIRLSEQKSPHKRYA